MTHADWLGYFWVTMGHLVTWPIAAVALLMKRRHPSATVAWLMAIVLIPVLGPLLFVVFGINRVERRIRGKKLARLAINRAFPKLDSHMLMNWEADTPRWGRLERSLCRLVWRLAEIHPTIGNRVQIFIEGEAAFREIERSLAAAKSSIHLEYYIWQPDRLGTRLRDLLIAKAKAGVEVRFLYDTIGSLRLTHRFLQPMRDAGVHVAAFVPGKSFRERWSFNLRSHRKIVLIDGCIGYTGGMNVGDEYLGKSPHFGRWRDTHLRLEGPAVQQLQEVFIEDWCYASSEQLSRADLFPATSPVGDIHAQVIAGGPDNREEVFHKLMFAAINEAESHLTLATSYFVPTSGLVSALECAAQRGVKCRVLVSGPRTYWLTYHAGRSFYETLLSAGVEIYEYHEGLQHAKTLSIDGRWSLIGTPNFDARSVILNFEVAVAIYDEGVAGKLLDHFATDITHAIKIDRHQWLMRSWQERLKENYCRLFAPVL